MLIRKIGKRACSRMISQINHMFLNPSGCQRGSVLQNNQALGFVRVQSFQSTGPVRNPKVATDESVSQPAVSVCVNRISRLARSDAQSALFDYLHCTRGFSFTDADHISKNSPHFLQDLLYKVDIDQDASRALCRFFRYHPINEFEPFLESLGLSPSEVASLLPHDLIFMDDDSCLLDNFHVLCEFGIPRIKIGKIYKEATEIFRYEFGILKRKLKGYEELGLSRPTVIKLVTCCPLLLVGDVNKAFVCLLDKLKELGFESDWIGGYISSKDTLNCVRVLDTMNFLSEAGYGDEEMRILIKMNPALLFEGSGKQIYVLIGRLLKLGLKMNEVYALFLENPYILSPRCVKNLLKALYFLYEIGMETVTIAKIVSQNIKLLGLHTLKGPKTIMSQFKGDKERLRQVIREDFSNLFSLASKANMKTEDTSPDDACKLLEKTTFLVRLGYIENSDEMAKALKKFRGRGDQLQERFNCLVQAGLDPNVVSNMIRQAPSVVNQSKDVLEKKLDCLRKLGYPVECIESFPSYLCYDMERINVRLSMYDWLRKKGAAKPSLSVSTLLACADARFERYFVDVHPEGPAMWKSLKESHYV